MVKNKNCINERKSVKNKHSQGHKKWQSLKSCEDKKTYDNDLITIITDNVNLLNNNDKHHYYNDFI